MIIRTLVLLIACFMPLLASPPRAAAQTDGPREVRIAYLTRADDPFYVASAGYAGIYGPLREPSLAAAELAVKEARIIGRAAGLAFSLTERTLEEGETVGPVLSGLAAEGVSAAILDLPEEEVAEAALQGSPLVLFNIRHRGMGLRGHTCNTRLFHVMPSEAMLQDGLVQHLLALGWRQVAMLEGELEEDRPIAEAFEASARKYGLVITAKKTFTAGNDPRRREQSNVKLLLSDVDADVIFVAEAARDFARFIAYNTPRPAMVVGAAGLVPAAWSPLWERHGAPQLNKRFLKAAGRPMLAEDWASWVAVRAVVEAHVRTPDLAARDLGLALLDPELRLELYKGLPGSFRPWDHQLRQTVLLSTGEAVVGLAPVEGVLHRTNVLDTLGPDEPEFRCAR
jgi:ABC transporter substrate binding protein (PQQ-dependent alcohol dehydrogenase system)